MSVSPADIVGADTGIAPEFATLSNVLIQNFINDAELSVNPDFWGVKTDAGVKYLTAHRLTISYPEGSTSGGAAVSGPITKEKVGDLERTYGSTSGSSSGSSVGDAMMATTKYGGIFLSLQEEIPGGPMVITPGLDQSGIIS